MHPYLDYQNVIVFKQATLFLISATIILCYSQCYGQSEQQYNHEVSISSANDAFLIIGDDLDRFYSFGFGSSIKIKDRKLLGIENWFSKKVDYYFELGIRIEGYTPTNKEVSEFEIQSNTISFDRPFAGVSYGFFNATYGFKRSFFRSGIILGIIGENSQAGDIQTWFHENITNDQVFRDEWVYQVPNQLIYNINLEYAYDLLPNNTWLDVYAAAQAQLGNFRINATPSIGLRIGKFEKIAASMGFDNSILGGKNNFELFLQSNFSVTANAFDATAQGNIMNRNFEFEVEQLNPIHSTFQHSIYMVYKMVSLGYEQYFTRGVTLKNAQHSYGRFLLQYRF